MIQGAKKKCLESDESVTQKEQKEKNKHIYIVGCPTKNRKNFYVENFYVEKND